MAAPLLFRAIPLLRLRLHHNHLAAGLLAPLPPPRRAWCGAAAESSRGAEDEDAVSRAEKNTSAVLSARDPPKYPKWEDHPDFRKWKDKENEILKDIEAITLLTKDILHSDRYLDGERLTAEDERAVVQKLLAYHPNSEDKIGCGLDCIMVDRHPQFKHSRCLFVVRTDGGWIDFSYQKCLRAYVREKYPSYAERFIREHFKRGSG